jgi:hypothetical protein
MAYHVNITKAAEWLTAIQNLDGGWGLTRGQVSSLVNTSEALYVLSCAGLSESEAALGGLRFLKDNFDNHLLHRGSRTRFAAFPLIVIASQYPNFDHRFQKKLFRWISGAVSEGGGWPSEVGGASDIYSTYLCVLAVHSFDKASLLLRGAKSWMLAQANSRGWCLDDTGAAPLSATAYALIALHTLGETGHDTVARALEALNGVSHWGDEEAPLSGTLWKHSTHSNVLTALALYSEDIFNSQIAEGIRYSNKLISPQGGWMENDSVLDNRTVRAQYWTAVYSEILQKRFDPSKFVLRIDGERQAGVLKAPEFIHFLINTKFATVVPAGLYKYVIYATFALSFAVSIIFANKIPLISGKFWQAISLGLMALASYGIIVRKHVFPRFGIIVPVVIGALSFLDLAFGVSISNLFEFIRGAIKSLGDFLQSV